MSCTQTTQTKVEEGTKKDESTGSSSSWINEIIDPIEKFDDMIGDMSEEQFRAFEKKFRIIDFFGRAGISGNPDPRNMQCGYCSSEIVKDDIVQYHLSTNSLCCGDCQCKLPTKEMPDEKDSEQTQIQFLSAIKVLTFW